MGLHVIVACANEDQWKKICEIIKGSKCEAYWVKTLKGLESVGIASVRLPDVIMLDVDTIFADNRSIKELKKRFPESHILAISKAAFHPELSEAVSKHVFACLRKPLDSEEILFWLRAASKTNGDV